MIQKVCESECAVQLHRRLAPAADSPSSVSSKTGSTSRLVSWSRTQAEKTTCPPHGSCRHSRAGDIAVCVQTVGDDGDVGATTHQVMWLGEIAGYANCQTSVRGHHVTAELLRRQRYDGKLVRRGLPASAYPPIHSPHRPPRTTFASWVSRNVSFTERSRTARPRGCSHHRSLL